MFPIMVRVEDADVLVDCVMQHGTPNGLAEDIREVINDDVRQMTAKLNAKKQSLEQMSTEHTKEVC